MIARRNGEAEKNCSKPKLDIINNQIVYTCYVMNYMLKMDSEIMCTKKGR